MRAARWLLGSCLMAFGCSSGSGAPDGTATSTGPLPSAKAAAAGTEPGESEAAPIVVSLERSRTPRERVEALQSACDGGDAEACSSLSARFRGYGALAGCGVQRDRPKPSLKLLRQDGEADRRSYLRLVARACELGSEPACRLAEGAPRSYSVSAVVAESQRLRGGLETHALLLYQADSPASVHYRRTRDECMQGAPFEACWSHDLHGVHKTEGSEDGELPAPERERLLSICRDTHECTELLLMLDKAHVPLNIQTEVRHAMGEILASACVEGDCTCGEAARHLPPDDARRLGLAQAGCDNGEAEGCYELGVLIERGEQGAQRDEARAAELYEEACPDEAVVAWEHYGFASEVSPRACNRMADFYAEPTLDDGTPRYFEQVAFYAERACARPGRELDHAHCLRAARLAYEGPRTGRNLETALYYALGPESAPTYRKECERPSVVEACKEVEDITSKRER